MSFNNYQAESPARPPCGKDCPNRRAGCHAECGRWAEYVEIRDKNYEQRAIRCANAGLSPAEERIYRSTTKRKNRKRNDFDR